MLKSRWKWAFLLVLGLTSVLSNAAAVVGSGCTPVQQQQVAPGDTIDLQGPNVPAGQQALGIHWDYYWTVKENDAAGSTVATSDNKSISFVVPTSEYATNYYFQMMVTAREARTCINQACMIFPIVKPGPCSITTVAADQICIEDAGRYTYNTTATPGQVNQRWWVFPLGGVPANIEYNGHTEFRVGDGASITIKWNELAQGSGTYVVITGYYGKKSPYVLQGSCQKQVSIVDVPLNTITVT